jgi:hypothetical protein
MIGKHYLVACSSQPNKFRHYTICNTFLPKFYYAITHAVDAALASTNEEVVFDKSLLTEESSSSIWLTLKNYEVLTGVSTAIYNAKNQDPKPTFTVKGPMGKGLQLTQTSSEQK